MIAVGRRGAVRTREAAIASRRRGCDRNRVGRCPQSSLTASMHLQQRRAILATVKSPVILFSRRILSDQLTPVIAYRRLVAHDERTATSFLLESVEQGGSVERIMPS